MTKFYSKMKYLDKAVERISAQSEIKDYYSSINWVKKRLYKDRWFNIIEEIMVILELIKSGYKVLKKINMSKNVVDILIPNSKFIIELDKNCLNCKNGYKHLRGNTTKSLLGSDWEAIGLSSEFINNDLTKLTT